MKLLRSTEHVSVLLLNLGNVSRPPHLNNGKQQLPRSLQESDQYWVLPHYLVRNTAHCAILLEAGGLERHSDLSQQYNKMCLVAMPDGRVRPIACVCSSDGVTSRIELSRRIHLDSDRLKWLARAASCGARSLRIPMGASRPAKVSAPIFAKRLRMAKILPRIWALPRRQLDSVRPSPSMPNARTMKVR